MGAIGKGQRPYTPFICNEQRPAVDTETRSTAVRALTGLERASRLCWFNGETANLPPLTPNGGPALSFSSLKPLIHPLFTCTAYTKPPRTTATLIAGLDRSRNEPAAGGLVRMGSTTGEEACRNSSKRVDGQKAVHDPVTRAILGSG